MRRGTLLYIVINWKANKAQNAALYSNLLSRKLLWFVSLSHLIEVEVTGVIRILHVDHDVVIINSLHAINFLVDAVESDQFGVEIVKVEHQ